MKQKGAFFLGVFLFSRVMVFSQETAASEPAFPPTAIINAAYMGDVEMMKRILSTNPDRDVRDAMGETALHVAVFRSNLEVIKLLLDNGFDINATVPSSGYTPLHYCVWFNNISAARFLLSRKADRNIKDKNGLTPVEKAAKEAKREMMMVLARQ